MKNNKRKIKNSNQISKSSLQYEKSHDEEDS